MKGLALVAVAAGLALSGCTDPTAALVAALDSGHAETRKAAARALGELGDEGASAVPRLVRAVGDPDAVVGDLAVQALGEIGRRTGEHPPAVMALLDAASRGEIVRRALACWALGRIGGSRTDVRAALETAERSEVLLVRQAARGALRRLPRR